jgi:hypothetical protein
VLGWYKSHWNAARSGSWNVPESNSADLRKCSLRSDPAVLGDENATLPHHQLNGKPSEGRHNDIAHE